MKIGISGPLVGAGFTQGSVIFAGVGGVLAQDNPNFFWNDADNRLGIGTATPACGLSVKQTSTGHVNIGQLNNNSSFSGISIGTSSAAVTAGNYSLLGDGTDTRLSAPGGSVYHMISNTALMRMTSTGLFIGGATAPSFLLDVEVTRTTAGVMSLFQPTFNLAAPEASAACISTVYNAIKTGAQNLTSAVGGLRGLSFSCSQQGSGTLTEIACAMGTVSSSGSGTVTRGIVYAANSPTLSGGVGTPVTNTYAFHARSQAATGVTNSYGLYCEGASDISYINGFLGIGTNAPAARLAIAAGTATAGTGPLRFTTAGSDVLGTPVSGVMEVDPNDNLFYTITTGAARKRIVMADPVGGLTSGRVPFATTNGRLTDVASLTFDGTTLYSTFATFDDVNLLDIFVDGGAFINWQSRFDIYNGVAVEGFGVPAIVDNVDLTAQTANIASTNFTNAGTAGTYRVQYYMVCTTSAVGAGSISFVVAYNDGTAARTLTGTALVMTATNRVTTFTDTVANGSLIRLGSGSISYSVTVTGIYSTAVYALYITLERLS